MLNFNELLNNTTTDLLATIEGLDYANNEDLQTVVDVIATRDNNTMILKGAILYFAKINKCDAMSKHFEKLGINPSSKSIATDLANAYELLFKNDLLNYFVDNTSCNFNYVKLSVINKKGLLKTKADGSNNLEKLLKKDVKVLRGTNKKPSSPSTTEETEATEEAEVVADVWTYELTIKGTKQIVSIPFEDLAKLLMANVSDNELIKYTKEYQDKMLKALDKVGVLSE